MGYLFPQTASLSRKRQAMYRAFVAKREVMVIRANRDEFERRRLEETRATVLIQSGVRGRAARRTAAAKRAAIVDAAQRERGLLIIQVRNRCKMSSWYWCCCKEGLYSARKLTSLSTKGVSRYVQVIVRCPLSGLVLQLRRGGWRLGRHWKKNKRHKSRRLLTVRSECTLSSPQTFAS